MRLALAFHRFRFDRIGARVFAAGLVLWTERLTRAFWPALVLVLALAAVAMLLPVDALPVWLHLPLLLAAIGVLAFFIWRGLTRLEAPRQREAERRLELDSGLQHRPFAILRDRPAGLAAEQQAAWAVHRERASASLTRLRLRGPRPFLPTLDPLALRSAAVLLLFSAFVIAGPDAGGRLGAALLPGFSSLFSGVPVRVQAWIQPPSYTGLGPMFLSQAGGDVTVPAGSKLSVSLTGGRFRPHLHAPGASGKFEALGNDSYQAAAVLNRSGTLRISRLFGGVASWNLTVLANDAPVAAWTSPPSKAPKSLATQLPWQVSQRWGVASLEAELQPDGRPDLPKLDVRIPLPGTPKDAHGSAAPDLSANPYAGVSMSGRLVATDVSGQHGTSDAVVFTLPQREFHHPLARAIADLRRRLALHPSAGDDAAGDLSALADAPGAFAGKKPGAATGLYLNMASVAALLTTDKTQTGFDQAESRLWIIALDLDGALPDASQRALAEAREDMRRALDEKARGKLPDGELARRLDALKDALDKRLQDLAKQAVERGALQHFDPKTDHLSSNAMDRMIRKMEQAAREGRMEDAKQQMAELEKMLDQLNNAKIMSHEQAQQQAEANRRGRQMMGAVQDMVKRETGLLDHAQSRAPAPMPELPPQFRNFDFQHQDGTDDPTQDQQEGKIPLVPQAPEVLPPDALPGQDKAAAQQADARTQRALQRALDALRGTLQQSGTQVPKNLDAAGHDMEQAANSLAQHEDRPAAEAVGKAIADLQQGGRDMARQMSKQGGGQMQLSLEPGSQGQQGGENGDDEAGEGQDQRGRDPLGRRVDGNGKPGDDPNLRVPDQMEEGRSRAIQDELRRRGADRGRPQHELDYIDRLLKPF